MSFDPITFLSNVEWVFSGSSSLSMVRAWTRPTKISSRFESPEVSIELLAGSIDSISLSYPNRQVEFYVRFVAFEEQGPGASVMGQIYSGIIDTVRDNPTLKDRYGKSTCDYFGAFYGRNITFDLAATEKNSISVNAMRIDVPCLVREM